MAEGGRLSLGYFMADFYDAGVELSEHKACRESDFSPQSDRNRASFDYVQHHYRLVTNSVHEEAGSDIDSSAYNLVDGENSTNSEKVNKMGNGCSVIVPLSTSGSINEKS